jgi:hypothetical protein
MAESSRIGGILDHLAWLRADIALFCQEMKSDDVLKRCLFVYNAATLFEWYVTVSRPETPQFPYPSRDQGQAKTYAHRFVLAVVKSVDKIQETQPAESGALSASVGDIKRAIDTFFESLPKSFAAGIHPVRSPELETPVNAAELLAERIASIPASNTNQAVTGGAHSQAAEPSMPVMQVLAGIFAMDDLTSSGDLLPEARAVLRDISSGYLADALDQAAEATDGEVARRFRRLGRQVTESITKADGREK